MDTTEQRLTLTTLLNEDKINAMLDHCFKRPSLPMAEVGVFNGGFVSLLSETFPDASVYAYDTFEGMPESCWQVNEPHKVKEFTSHHNVVKALRKRNNVVVRKGIFPGSIKSESGFWMVHLDVDFYLSTLNSLRALVPRMAPGGSIFLDDWEWDNCPGVMKAVQELDLKAVPTVSYQAMIQF